MFSLSVLGKIYKFDREWNDSESNMLILNECKDDK